MTQLRTSMIIDLAGNLASRANSYLGSMQRLGTGGSRSMQILQRSVHAVGQGLDRLGNRYTALLSGAAGIGAIKQVGDMSERLTYLGIQAKVSRQEINKLYNQILDVAQAPDIRVDPSELLAGVETIVEKLGDLDLAKGSLKNIGYVIRATGAAGKDAGDMIANFKEKFNLKDNEVLPALDTLVVQGKAGAFTLRDMVTQGNRVTAAYGAMGRKGPEAIREMGAALQVFRKSSGSAEETSTAFKNFFNDLMEPAHRKVLEANGIKIWDPKALKEGRKEIRSIVEITDQLLEKSKGDPEKLGRILGMQAMDGFKAVLSEYLKTGKNPMYEFLEISGDGKELMSDSARAAEELNAAIQNLQTSWQRFAQSNLAKPVQSLADALNSLDPGTVQRWLKAGAGITAGLGALILARKAFGLYEFGRDIMTGGGKKGGLSGMGGSAGPIPVYVVNKHLSMLPGQGWGFPGQQGGGTPPAGGTAGKVGKVVKAAGNVFAVGGAAEVGWSVGSYINQTLVDGTAIGDAIGAGLNRIAAALGNKESKLVVELNSKDGTTAQVKSIRSRGMELNVDTGLMMRAH